MNRPDIDSEADVDTRVWPNSRASQLDGPVPSRGLPQRAGRPMAASPALPLRPRARRWPLWLTMAASSSALVAAGYLGALVQLDKQPHAPVVTSLPSAEPSTDTTAAESQAEPAPSQPASDSPPNDTAAIASPLPSTASKQQAWRARREAGHAYTAALSPTDTTSPPPRADEAIDDGTSHVLNIQPLSPAVATHDASQLPAQPGREDVQHGLEGVRSQLAACLGELHGTIYAHVTIGSAGRVNYSLVQGDFVGTPQGSCMARVLRTATFPPFTGASFKVEYPFTF